MPTRKKRPLTRSVLKKKLAGIEALILDVDGVLTDDSLYVGSDGFELKRFNIGDGLMMVLAMRAGLEIIIMSNRPSAATTTRMNDLRVKHVIQERGDKAKLVIEYITKSNLGLDLRDAAYIGNDIMDITLAREAGIGIAVGDSHPELLEVADYVTVKKGGQGAVREIIDLYFKGRGLKPADFLKR